MPIENARGFFEALAARGRDERLADAVGAWEFDIEDAGTWTVTVDHGALRVARGRGTTEAERRTTRIHLREDELVRLARGDGHDNVFSALIRGAVVVHGELAFAQRLQSILPLAEAGRGGP